MEVNPTVLIGCGTFLVGIVALASKLIDNGNGKRKKLYERIEDERKDAEEKYMKIDLCTERSGNIVKKLDSIEGKMDKLLTKNGIEENR